MNKYIQHVLLKTKRLEQSFLNDKSLDLLKVFKQLPQSIDHRHFYKNYKFMYLYVLYHETNRFDDAYKEVFNMHVKSIEAKLLSSVLDIVGEAFFEDRRLNAFITERIVPLYINRYSIYPITSVSYLPLKLRLYVYYKLYTIEDNEEVRCHLRNRLSVTLARFHFVDIANHLTLYNWVLAQATNAHFAKSTVVKSSLQSIDRHHTRYLKRNVEEETGLKQPMAEIYRCFDKLLGEHRTSTTLDSAMCLDLIVLHYEQYQELKEVSLCIKSYLRTSDKVEFYETLSKQRLTLLKESIHLPSYQLEYTLPLSIKSQLQLYDKLIVCSETLVLE